MILVTASRALLSTSIRSLCFCTGKGPPGRDGFDVNGGGIEENEEEDEDEGHDDEDEREVEVKMKMTRMTRTMIHIVTAFPLKTI